MDNEDNYFELVEGKDLNSTYGLVVRMFSKIPFLQYKFKTELAPDPIEIQIERNLNKDLISYHSFLDKTSSKFLDYLFISRQMAISLGF